MTFRSTATRFGAIALAAVAAAEVSISFAESWVEYRGSYGASDVMQLDVESVKQTSDHVFSATWREQASFSESLYETAVGHVFCGLKALVIDQLKIPDPLSSIPAYRDKPGVTLDFIHGTLPPQDRLRRYDFPTPGSAAEALVNVVCQRDATAVAPGSINVRAALGCSESRAMKSHPICSGKPALEAAGAGMLLRLEQARQVCHRSEDERRTILGFLLNDTRDANACGDGDCVRALHSQSSNLGLDVARSLEGQECTEWDSLLAQAAERAKEETEGRNFWKCVTHSIPRLDDGGSGADVIASSVFEVCVNTVGSSLELQEALRNRAVPKITSLVLEHRAQRAKKSPPRPPQSNQSQTTL